MTGLLAGGGVITLVGGVALGVDNNLSWSPTDNRDPILKWSLKVIAWR